MAHSHKHNGHHDDETPDVSHISNPTVLHEVSDVDPTPIYKFGFWLSVSLVLTGLLCWWLFYVFTGISEKDDVALSPLAPQGVQRNPPEPRLQLGPAHPEHPLDEMIRVIKEEEVKTTEFAWIDQGAQKVRIPVALAMQIMVDKQAYSTSGDTTLTAETGEMGKAAPSTASSGRMMEWRYR